MDIAAVSVVLNNSKIADQAGVQVMKLAMDTVASQSKALTADMVQLMQQSVQPHLGGNVDIKV
ncbi:YjfB family protein [Thermosinus carboxydivorans]|uniref:YjfB family protein n=1 Tax=Thermosinus carboxydivorans TaxID=261685 RepID=UPI0002EB4E8A|nr:YjfB family protein [Thermosinus carboxydivorans]